MVYEYVTVKIVVLELDVYGGNKLKTYGKFILTERRTNEIGYMHTIVLCNMLDFDEIDYTRREYNWVFLKIFTN